MKLFCTYCGTPQELDAPPARVRCTQCGKEFATTATAPSPAPSPGAPAKSGGGIALWIIILGACGFCLVPLVGILAAIAIPNFIKYQARAKQSEARMTLKQLYVLEASYFEENQHYSTDLHELGFSPEPGNRYAYFLDGTSPAAMVSVDVHLHPQQQAIATADLETLPVSPGLTGTCPKCAITIVAAGNIDSDPTLDVWSISSESRTSASHESIPAGTPHNDLDDIRE